MIRETHIDEKIQEKSKSLMESVSSEETIPVENAPDRMFIAQKMRILFKNTGEEGILGNLMKIISVPLTLIRDYTVPIGEEDQWDRMRASVIPMTLVISFLFLNGNIHSISTEEKNKDTGQMETSINKSFVWGLIFMIPGAIVGVIIKLKTKVTEAPSMLITIFAILCFIMSIMWIQFTCNCIMDLLQLFGFITKLPEALLALTIIAWGNCLGDMAADVAMTKKGFGEMAITGCVAGPIFNVLIGIGLSNTIAIFNQPSPMKAKVHFSLYAEMDNGSIVTNKVAILPMTLLIAQLVILVLILLNGVCNGFHITYKWATVSLIFYACVIVSLVTFSIIADVHPPSD